MKILRFFSEPNGQKKNGTKCFCCRTKYVYCVIMRCHAAPTPNLSQRRTTQWLGQTKFRTKQMTAVRNSCFNWLFCVIYALATFTLLYFDCKNTPWWPQLLSLLDTNFATPSSNADRRMMNDIYLAPSAHNVISNCISETISIAWNNVEEIFTTLPH